MEKINYASNAKIDKVMKFLLSEYLVLPTAHRCKTSL